MNLKTKIIMGMCLMVSVGTSMANDLIFKTGFENQYAIGGQVNGLTSSPLVLELISVSGPDEVTITTDGTFYFELLVSAGHAWRVELKSLPSQPGQQSCQLSNNSGSALPVGGVNDVNINCQNQAWDWDVMDWDQGGWN